MTNWITDERGNRTFTHGGWAVEIGSDWIRVMGPCPDHEVSVDSDGLWVRGADTRGHDEHPESFTIPWTVIGAIIEARAIVG